MAELFADPSFWKNNGQQPAGNYTGVPEVDRELDQMPEEERQAAIAEITAPPTGEEIAGMIQAKQAVGEVANVTREQYRLYKAYSKTKETDVLEAIGMGADMVWNDLQKAAGSMYDKPIESVAKLTPSLIEAFSQGTRSMYGMLSESQDPNSVLFRVKNAIYTGSDEDAEYEQFMQALDFNAKSARLMQGKETLVMDKDLINPEMTQAMSYIADPSLFIPFEGVALKGAQLIGMAEGLAKASARATAIKQMVIGGTLRWGVGAPIEAIGGATRATIDAAVERGSRAISAVTGMQTGEIASAARMTGLSTLTAEAAGLASGVTEAYVGASAARGIGEAIGAVGEQMMRGERGVLSYAGQALRESMEGGAKLTPQAENLLKAIDFVDPMFSYTADVTKGATQGAFIGGGLGYLSGGEEGMAQGIGAGAVLGGVGAGFGRIYADISGATKTDRMRITTDLGLNILAETNPTQAKDYSTLRAVAQVKGVNVDGYISGLLRIAPDLDTYFKSGVDHSAEITARGFDPKTYDGSFVDQNGRRLFSMAEFERAEGFVIDKAKDGRVTLGINLDNLKKNTVPHEAFHTIFRSVVMEPEFQKRMTESVLGAFDKDGKQISAPKVSQTEAVAFFDRYLKALHKGDKLNEQRGLLKQALEEYYRDGQTKVMAEDGKTPYLANLSEEFGAYYFTQFIEGRPLDYLFLGGELGGIRGIMQSVQDGWLDYWEGRAKRVEPKFDMNNPDGIDYAFKPKGGSRVRVGAIDYLMQDLVRAATQRRQDGSVNLSRMSRDTRDQFLRSQGLDGVGETKQKPWRPKTSGGQDSVKIYNKTFGPEVHKAILAMPDNLRPAVDGNGDFVGPLSKEVLEQMVSTGHVSREMSNKIQVLQDMANGKMQSNIAEMGYVGWSMQQDVGPNPPRVYGDEVPYKRRKVLVLDVESKIGPKGMSFTAKTLDWQVIETRANNLWSDSRVRNRWNDDRGVFVQDFFRYLSNASKTDAQGRVPSNKLWAQDGDVKRDVMQQMAGIPKQAGETYAHPPIAEIHEDILNSVMNLTVNRMSDVRITGDNVFFDANKAAPFIRVNMKVADMPYEETPNGKVFTDKSSGFRFTQTAKGVTAFDRHGEFIGSYANLEDAGKFAKRVYERQQAAMKQVAMQVTDEASRGITHKSKAQFIQDNARILKDENVKAQFIKKLEEYAQGPDQETAMLAMKHIETIKTEGFTKEILDNGWFVPIDYNGQEIAFRNALSDEATELNTKWEDMFPRTFRSRLLDKVQSLHKANPNLSNQALIKKLLRDSSNGYRFYAEAEASGLLDFLRSQIDPTQRIQKQRDAQGNWTGGIKTVDKPFADNKIRGGRTDLPIDLERITDFIKNNEITLQVDDGANANITDTSQYVQEGTTFGYNETALRMPKKYAHGISGHYGPDVAVHHRSTVRHDINGEAVTFVDEIQANNAKEQNVDPAELKRNKTGLEAEKKALEIGDKYGIWTTTEQGEAGNNLHRQQLGIFESMAGTMNIKGVDLLNATDIGGFRAYEVVIPIMRQYHVNLDNSISQIPNGSHIQSVDAFLDAVSRDPSGVVQGLRQELGDAATPELAEKAIKFIRSKNGLMDNLKVGKFHAEKLYNAIHDAAKEYGKLERIVNPLRTAEQDLNQNKYAFTTTISDAEIRIQQMEKAIGIKPYPLQEISEWSAVALKDIITKSIADGRDLITITHPEDSPSKSNMDMDSSRDNYGRIFPDVAQKIVGKYGIEVKKRNELPALTDAQMNNDKAYKDATEARSKVVADAMEEFKKTQGQGESPDVISELSRQFSRTPDDLAKEFPDSGDIGVSWMEDKIMPLLGQVKSDGLRGKLTDVAQSIAYQHLQFISVKADLYSKYDPSVVAIDRGMSFRLNKEIKEAVMNGELRTAYKPEETPDWNTERAVQARANQPMKLWEYPATANFTKWVGGLPLIRSLSSQTDAKALAQGFVTTIYKGVRGRNFDTFKDRNMYEGVARDSYGRDVTGQKDPNYFVSDLESASDYAEARVSMSDAVKKSLKEQKAYSFGNADMYYVRSENPAVLTDMANASPEVIADVRKFWEKYVQDEFAQDPIGDTDETPRSELPEYKKLVEYNFDAFLKMVEEGRFLESDMDKKDMYFAIDKKYAEMEQLGHWNDYWIDFSKFLLEKGYDSVVVNDNSVSKNAPTIVIDQSSKNVKASSNYGEFNPDDVRFNFKPEEGGRTYTPEQKAGEFIGRYAFENKGITKGLKIFYGKIKGTEYSEGITIRNKSGEAVAHIDFSRHKDTASVNGSDVYVGYQGKGYGNLIYSELSERLRSEGIKILDGWITDYMGRPQKIRRKIIDTQNEIVGGERTKVSAKVAGGRDVESYLEQKAWYKPEEGDAPLRVNFAPDEVKKNLRSLQSAIDRQSDADKVPAGIKKGVGRLIQAVERQRKEDVKTMPQAVKEGFKALADAVDAQADMDKVPAGVRKGLRLLFESAQYEDLKPQQGMPKPTASEEQLASGIEALGRAVGVSGQVRRQPQPQAKPAPTAAMPQAQPAPSAQPTPPPLPVRPTPEPSSTAWMSWTQEKTANGGFIRNALGYVIIVNKSKFKVYNPAKVLVGIYEDEESAKRRVLKDMPRR